MPTYFIRSEQIRSGQLSVGGPLAHHLREVLRLRIGERLHLIDEGMRGYLAEIKSVERDQIRVLLLKELVSPPFSSLSISLGQAILKGDKMDWAIQKGTELGVSRIVPLITGRTVVRPSEGKRTLQRDRWQKIALEAAQQSGRWDVPRVEPVETLNEFLAGAPKEALRLLPWEKEAPGAGRAFLLEQGAPAAVVALVGPEGGFLDEEVSRARGSGFHSISLGPRVLRAETASVVLLALLQHYWGDLG